MLLIALAVVPLWTVIQQPFLSWFGALFNIDTSRIRIEASIARLLLLVWSIIFMAAHAQGRIATLWRNTPWSQMAVIAGALVLTAMFVTLVSAAGISVFFRSMTSGPIIFPSLYLEDGVMENLTVVAFVISCVCLLLAALRLRRRAPAVSMVLVVMALGGFLIGGEELSWGQRIFGWHSPEYFVANNVQDETNLHNLLSWNVMAHLTMLLMAGLALASIFAEEIAAFLPLRGLALVIPPPGVRLALLIVPFTQSLVSYNELTEEIVSWIFMCYAIGMLRAAGASSPSGPRNVSID